MLIWAYTNPDFSLVKYEILDPFIVPASQTLVL
jgi:hypothetical protein